MRPNARSSTRSLLEERTDNRLLSSTIERVLRTGRVGSAPHHRLKLLPGSAMNRGRSLQRGTRAHAPRVFSGQALRCSAVRSRDRVRRSRGDRAAITNLIDNARENTLAAEADVAVETARLDAALRGLAREGPRAPASPSYGTESCPPAVLPCARVPARIAHQGYAAPEVCTSPLRSVAKRHGGRAWAESEGDRGTGSTFAPGNSPSPNRPGTEPVR